MERSYGRDFLLGALATMQRVVGPAPASGPAVSTVTAAPVACYMGLGACPDGASQFLSLDDGQVRARTCGHVCGVHVGVRVPPTERIRAHLCTSPHGILGHRPMMTDRQPGALNHMLNIFLQRTPAHPCSSYLQIQSSPHSSSSRSDPEASQSTSAAPLKG